MKKLLSIVLTAVALFALSSCHHFGKGVRGSGVRKTEKRDLAAFKSIETNGAFEIQVTSQQPASFEIEGDDNLLPLVKTEVRNGVLRIYNDESFSATKAITVRLAVPDLEAISSTGASDIQLTNVKNDQLTISWQGAGRIHAAGETKFVHKLNGRRQTRHRPTPRRTRKGFGDGRSRSRCLCQPATGRDGFRSRKGYLPRQSGRR